jgi:DNA-binding protein YbaB
MFNKLKQYKDLRSQAKILQNALAEESTAIEKNGVKIIMNGNMEITLLSINSDLDKSKLESTLTDCFNDSIKKTQRLMAQKMQELGKDFGGFNL